MPRHRWVAPLSPHVLLTGKAGEYEAFYRDAKPRVGSGDKMGRVIRRRHTVRTAYKGTRIGYDRQHTCWAGDFLKPMPGVRCYPTMAEVANIMVREWVEAGHAA